MARQTCPLASQHVLCLISVFIAAFLVRSNESLVPIWGTRCISGQAVSNLDRARSCLRPSFFRDDLSSTAMASSENEDDQETPIYFFADKEIDESDEMSAEEIEAEKAAEEEKAAKERAAAEEEAAKERAAAEAKAAEQAKLDEIARQAKLEEEIKLADEERERMLEEMKKSATGAFETVEKAIKPFTEIQDGVPKERIKGAAIAATAVTLLVSKGVVASGAVGLSAAYLSVSKTIVGDFLRQVGETTWNATESASKVAGQISLPDLSEISLPTLPKFGEVDKTVVNKYKRPKSTKKVDVEAEDDDDLSRVLKEAETVISEADAAIAKAEAEQKEESEHSKEEELTAVTEIEEQDKEVEEDEGEGVLEDDEEEGQDDIGEDEAILDESEEENVEEDGDLEEDSGILGEEEDENLDDSDDVLFDDDQFMAAVELAQEGIEGKIVGVDDIIADESIKAEWDAAGELANELRQDMDTTSEAASVKEDTEDDFLEDIDFEFEDVDVEALGRAAREAVETFETQQREADEALLDEKQQWADSMVEEDDEFDFDGDEDLFSSESLDAARAAVEAAAEGEVATEQLVSKDWSSLKVVELKEELKKRGLKTSGKKADLVSMLEESDLSLSEGDEDATSSIEDADDNEILEIDDFDIEELGRQARAAVEMFQTSADSFDEEPTEEMLAELESELAINGEFVEETEQSVDFSKMTVAQLKDECRSRGLKVGGKKAELIERLETSTD